ncbi:ammonium transporter [Geothrix sp. 21YS21S-4]|uniref:ammonium transporter n=1 Tax=Geothrix sp. 21YS21S-4 TaxID=3068889 RepID=UPI0027BAD61E|nr:ammonium transporter [Geothrix sp. 21YS21S-4]
MSKQWLVPFLILAAVALAGIVIPPQAQALQGGPVNAGDTAWMLTASGLVLLMTPGLSFFYGGMVRRKNMISTMLQSFITMGAVSLVWVVVGFSLAFGTSIGAKGLGFIGNPATFFMFRGVGTATHPDLAPTIPLLLFAIFQMKFAIITPALVTGSFAERVRFTAYLVFMILFTVFVYCPVAHWTWHPNGFLRNLGILDFAGGSVVHMTAGLAALVGAYVLGPRRDFDSGAAHPPANIPYVILGTGMLWFGWFGFNAGSALSAGSAAATAFITTNTASAAAMLAWVFLDGLLGRKPTALGACVAAVVGLVAITPAAGFVSTGSSIAIGAVAAVLSNFAVFYKGKAGLDDTLDVFPCHGVGGMFGMVATALFASKLINPDGADGLIHGHALLLGKHLLGLVVVAAYSVGMSWILYKVTAWLVPLRVSAEQEAEGLDLSQHGERMLPMGPQAD